MVLRFTTSGLNELCSSEQQQLLDAIDALRSQGISHYVSLPQIIVCGDQSSGKSSVLEAISGVPFPIKSNTCTRFPTELVLRNTRASYVNVSVVPHHSRDELEKASMSNFDTTLSSLEEVPVVIDQAKDLMGIHTRQKSFSKDVLRIEIGGPDRPHLTIVDLPGLIHSENKHQSAADVNLINDVVRGYMNEPRSIILAVISAKNDYANQVVLSLARKADPKGYRTLGVITKPDTLIPGSGSEAMYMSLARNADIEFRLGWHVLKNRDTDAEYQTLADRDSQERAFFAEGAWSGFPSSQLGICTLRVRLSKLLLHQIATELPALAKEIETSLEKCRQHLRELGRPRTSPQEQRTYLTQISQDFQSLVQAAVDGSYDNLFFGDVASKEGSQKRLRAVIQNLNQEFADKLARDGQRDHALLESSATSKKSVAVRAEYLVHVESLLSRTRGRELPGLFNPMIVSDLFKEQSSPWSGIAGKHIKAVWRASSTFLGYLIKHVADTTTVQNVMDVLVVPKLQKLLAALDVKMNALLEPLQNGHPITYNHYLTETLQNLRGEREQARIDRIINQTFGIGSAGHTISLPAIDVDFQHFRNELLRPHEADMDHLAASEALDYSLAYYKVARKRFVDDLAVEAVEECLISQLKDILSPILVSSMSDKDLDRVAGETEDNRNVRDNLEAQLAMLEKALDTFKGFALFKMSDLVGDEADGETDDEADDDASDPVGNASDNGDRDDTVPSATPERPESPATHAEPAAEPAESFVAADDHYWPGGSSMLKTKKKKKKTAVERSV